MDCIYCTPEWLEESAKVYQANPRLQEALKRLVTSVFFRITAKPEWGIDSDFIFGAFVNKGALSGLRFYNEEEAKEKAEFILSATPEQWKMLLRKEHKFITDFMLGRIKLEKGSIPGVVGIAPYSDTFIDALTQVKLIFQDELTPQQLSDYREYASMFRRRLGI